MIAQSHHNTAINLSSHRITQPYSTTATSLGAITNGDGIIKKMLKRFQNSKSKLRAGSALLYENIADGVNYIEFFTEFQLKDTFNSWFLVTELHVWLLCTRVMHEGADNKEDGRFLRNCLVESMWSDVQSRSKKLGNDNPSFKRKQIEILSEQFQATLISYDEGLWYDDKALAGAIWRRFFEGDCSDFTKLEKLVKYVRRTAKMLDEMNRNQLLNDPKVNWLKLNE